jgi:hypothetical protein
MEILSGGKLNVCIHSNGVLVVELKKKWKLAVSLYCHLGSFPAP